MKVSIRVDSSFRIGLGHAYRCLAIAEALREQGVDVEVLTRPLEGSQTTVIFRDYVVQVLGSELHDFDTRLYFPEQSWGKDAQILDAERCLQTVQTGGTILVDNYGLGAEWENVLENRRVRIFRMSDFLATTAQCTRQIRPFLWGRGNIGDSFKDSNPNEIVGNAVVPLAKMSPKVLLASQMRSTPIHTASPHLISLHFGQTPPVQHLERVLSSVVNQTEDFPCEVQVLGSTASTQKKLASHFETVASVRFVPIEDREPSIVRSLESDLVIGAAGVSALERLHLGIPQLVLPISRNQLPNSKALSSWGIAAGPQLLDETSDSMLDALVGNAIDEMKSGGGSGVAGRLLLDRFGAGRVANYIIGDSEWDLQFRDAQAEDAPTFFLWANTQSVKQSAGRTREIDPKEHLEWFSNVLNSKSTQLTVLTVNGVPAGQCRLQAQFETGDVILDYSVDSLYRGRGFAQKLIEQSISSHRSGLGKTKYVAEVRPENLASQRALSAVDFLPIESNTHLLRFQRTENEY